MVIYKLGDLLLHKGNKASFDHKAKGLSEVWKSTKSDYRTKLTACKDPVGNL